MLRTNVKNLTMNSSRWIHLTLLLTISAPICKAAIEAIDDLYRRLPAHTTLDEKCKRYAVLLNLPVSDNQASIDASVTAKLGLGELDNVYQQIQAQILVKSYIAALDEYRRTRLRPAFLELIECLRRFETSSVEEYLSNEELIFMTDLYKQAIRTPWTRIDLNQTDISMFPRDFQASLRNVFRGYLKEDSNSTQPEASQQEQSEHQAAQPSDTSWISSTRTKRLRLWREEEALTAEQVQELRNERRRAANRESMRRIRSRDPGRYREKERLRQRRDRILKSDQVRALDRERQKRRRDRLRAEQKRLDEQQRLQEQVKYHESKPRSENQQQDQQKRGQD